jgi:hypothetical protein
VLYLPDDDSAKVIGLLLRHAGFTIERATTAAELSLAATRKDVVLIVMTASSGPKGTDPLGGFQPTADRGYTLVALVQGDGQPARDAGADLVVSLPFDPGTLTNDLLEAMKR